MVRSGLRALFCAAALVAALVAAAPASAGTYTAGWCSLDGSSQTVAATGVTYTQGSNAGLPYWWSAGACGGYDYVRFENNTLPDGASWDFDFSAPADTYVSNVAWDIDAIARTSGAGDGVYAVDQQGNKLTAVAIGAGSSFSDGSASYSTAQGVRSIRASEFCSNSAGCAFNGSSYGNEMYFHGWQMTLVDPYDPQFSAAAGSGWQATPADSTADTVAYSLTDRGAGVKSVDLFVDGTKRATNNIACSRADVPCPLSDSGTFTLDTTQLSEGTHALRLTATDFSGNTTDTAQSVTIRRKPEVTAPEPGDPAGTNSNAPSIGGYTTPFTQGEQATGDRGNWTGDGISYAYQWQRCDVNGQPCTAIAGATSLTYTATSADVGHALVFCVTASSSGGTTTECSQPSALVQADSDGDGVPDALDKCPSKAAASADGCPAPTTATNDVNSVTGPPPTPVTKTTAPSAPGANGQNATPTARITAVLSNRSRTQRVGYGKRVPITGRLVAPDGRPVAAATVEVLVQSAIPGAKFAATADKVTTAQDGRFTYTAGAGRSRTIRFAYRAFSGDVEFADTSDVTLLVAGAVTLKAKPGRVRNRHAATFTGQLRGRPVPARGVLVDMQVWFHKKWRTFATPRTNRRGAFHYRYRFTQGAAKWVFRARIRKDSLYAYELGYSRKVRVAVTP